MDNKEELIRLLDECLEAIANLTFTNKGECLNKGEINCECTVCKINSYVAKVHYLQFA